MAAGSCIPVQYLEREPLHITTLTKNRKPVQALRPPYLADPIAAGAKVEENFEKELSPTFFVKPHLRTLRAQSAPD